MISSPLNQQGAGRVANRCRVLGAAIEGDEPGGQGQPACRRATTAPPGGQPQRYQVHHESHRERGLRVGAQHRGYGLAHDDEHESRSRPSPSCRRGQHRNRQDRGGDPTRAVDLGQVPPHHDVDERHQHGRHAVDHDPVSGSEPFVQRRAQRVHAHDRIAAGARSASYQGPTWRRRTWVHRRHRQSGPWPDVIAARHRAHRGNDGRPDERSDDMIEEIDHDRGAGGPRAGHALPQSVGAGRLHSVDPGRACGGPGRPERRRKVHAVEPGGRSSAANHRPHPGTRRPAGGQPGTTRPGRVRRPGPPTYAVDVDRRSPPATAAHLNPAGTPRTRNTASSSMGWTHASGPGNSPAANAPSWPSRWPSPNVRSSWSWTSRSPASTRSPAASFCRTLPTAVAEHQLSVVLSSHLVGDLERVCDYLIVLTDAHVQIAGTSPICSPPTTCSPVPGTPGLVAGRRGGHLRQRYRHPDHAAGTHRPARSTHPAGT